MTNMKYEKTPPRPLTESLILEREQKLDKQPNFHPISRIAPTKQTQSSPQMQFEIATFHAPLPTLPCTATVSTTCTPSRLDPQLLTLPLVCNISSTWLQHKSQPFFHLSLPQCCLSLLATSSNNTSTCCHFQWNRSHGTPPAPFLSRPKVKVSDYLAAARARLS